MTITGKVAIDGQISIDEGDKIAVFVGEECRGVANVKHDQGLNGYFVYLMVYGNKMGEILTFKVYDASQDKILAVQITLSFAVNNIVGSPDEPFLFTAISVTSSVEFPVPGLLFYPNPFEDLLHIDYSGDSGDIGLFLYSSTSQMVAKIDHLPFARSTLNTQGLSPGIYFLVWLCKGHRSYVKLIKS